MKECMARLVLLHVRYDDAYSVDLQRTNRC